MTPPRLTASKVSQVVIKISEFYSFYQLIPVLLVFRFNQSSILLSQSQEWLRGRRFYWKSSSLGILELVRRPSWTSTSTRNSRTSTRRQLGQTFSPKRLWSTIDLWQCRWVRLGWFMHTCVNSALYRCYCVASSRVKLNDISVSTGHRNWKLIIRIFV